MTGHASLDLLAVMAHPDDAEMLCGGALIKAARHGARVGILDLTAGEMGSYGSPSVRSGEAQEARRIMGLTLRVSAGLPDAGLENDPPSRSVVVSHLRALRPRVVVTHWKVGRHRDHRIASELVRDSCFLSGLRRLEAPGEPFRPTKLVYATAFREDVGKPGFVVDVSAEMETKVQALSAYTSQFEGATGLGEVFPGGARPFLEQVRAHMAHYGSLIRVAYGEPFAVDETLEVEDLSRLGVSTF